MIRPVEQEIFEATKWQIGNTGKSQKKDFNKDFIMKFRLVFTDKRKSEEGKNNPEGGQEKDGQNRDENGTKKGLLFKKTTQIMAETLENTGGSHKGMGSPNGKVDPVTPMSEILPLSASDFSGGDIVISRANNSPMGIEEKLNIFSTLPSVLAARRTENRLT